MADAALLRQICQRLPGWLPPPLGQPEADPPSGLPWPAFRDAVYAHCVTPLVAEGLAGVPGVDPLLTSWLDFHRQQNRLRLERLRRELVAVLCATEDLPLIPLKGPVLAELYYPDPLLRPTNDLDLLLPREHFPEATRRFAALGYHHVFSGWKHDKFEHHSCRRVIEETFEHRDNPRNLELHPRCREKVDAEIFDLTERLYASATRRTVLGEQVLVPAAGEVWLYLLLHATHHILLNNFRLLHLVDLALVTPAVEDPPALLAALDARVTYAPLLLLDRTFPGLGAGPWIAGVRKHLAPSFAQWAEGLDLYSASYLHPTPWRVD